MFADRDLTPLQRRTLGAERRKTVPRSSHADWIPAPDRSDPVRLLDEQNAQRLSWLVPYRYQRMAESPLAFFRGGARVMASDLAQTPVSGIEAQICGDAHISNFGLFASPERTLVFDINDFDETLVGPWEWDLKRLATSVALAARHNQFDQKTSRNAVETVVRAYRDRMQQLANLPALQIWYSYVRAEDIAPFFASERRLSERDRRAMVERHSRWFAKARSRNANQALESLTTQVNGEHRIKSDPPFMVPISQLQLEFKPEELLEHAMESFSQYRQSLPDARRHLLDRYRFVELAMKVVGIGSVGTRCFVALFRGMDAQDPLILQVKEANRSVLEEYLPPIDYTHHGQRVVEGQRLMQSVSDVFLGWSSDLTGHDYYWRQLRDMKLSANIERYRPQLLSNYAMLCGVTLAHSHARTGDVAAIAGYIGRGDLFVRALGEFANAYADQNDRDYATFTAALKQGVIESHEPVPIAS